MEQKMEERFKQFTTLIANINRSIRRIKTGEMVQYGLKSIHVSCIYYLYTEGALTVKALCDICEEDKANVSRAVDYLEEKGFIEKRIESVKRYKTPLRLTEQGNEVGENISNKIRGILVEVSRSISESDRETMYASLSKIEQNLVKVCEKYDF